MPRAVSRGGAGGGRAVNHVRLCFGFLSLLPIGGCEDISWRSFCKQQVTQSWQTSTASDAGSPEVAKRISEVVPVALSVNLHEGQSVVFPESAIKTAAGLENNGYLNILVLGNSGWRVSFTWIENQNIPLPQDGADSFPVPVDTVGFAKVGFERIGRTLSCDKLSKREALLFSGEVTHLGVLLSENPKNVFFATSGMNGLLVEETVPRNHDNHKIWLAVLFPHAPERDILRIRWEFDEKTSSLWKDVPLAMLEDTARLTRSPTWAMDLADVLNSRSVDKLRALAERNGWQFVMRTSGVRPADNPH